MSRVDQAVALFQRGYSCSQAVLAAFGEEVGLDEPTAFRTASAFGGGMGRMGEMCGALTGAFIVLGLRQGGVEPGPTPAKEALYGEVERLAAVFQARHGSLHCRQLLGCDLRTPEGKQRAHELRFTHCSEYVRTAAQLLETGGPAPSAK